MKKAFLVFLVLLFCAGSSYGTEYWCDPINGNTSNSGTSSFPWSTLELVFSSGKTFQPGDVIWLRNGFHGYPVIRGNNPGYVTIRAENGHHPGVNKLRVEYASRWVISGLDISPQFIGSYNNMNVNCLEMFSSSNNITVQDCSIYSVSDPAGWTQTQWENMANGIRCDAPNCLITNNTVRNIYFGISINKSSVNTVVSYNTVENVGADALRGLADYCKFEYNTVKNFYIQNANHDDIFQSWSTDANGVVGQGTVTGVELRGNIFISHTSPVQYSNLLAFPQAIGCFDGFFKDWVIENNLIINEHWHGISLYGAINCKIVNNTVVDNPLNLETTMTPWIGIFDHKTRGASSANLVRNNMTPSVSLAAGSCTADHNIITGGSTNFWVNYPGFDFHLAPGSPAIGAGSVTGAPIIDIEKNLRTVPYDAGCYEYGSGQENHTPVADAGPDQTVDEGVVVTLDGSASKDPDNNLLTFLWSAPGGITLSSGTAEKPVFMAPEVASDTEYSFSLVANDGLVNSSTDQVVITVKNVDKTPYVKDPIEDMSVARGFPQKTIDLRTVFADDDPGDVLTFSIVSNTNPGLVTAEISEYTLILTFSSEKTGTADVIVTAASNGKEISSSFSVEVYDSSAASQIIKVYPNPTAGNLNVVFDQIPGSNTYMEVINMSGVKVYEKLVQGIEETISLDGYPAGVYLLKTTPGTGEAHKVILR